MGAEQEPLFARKLPRRSSQAARSARRVPRGMVWPRHVRTDRLVVAVPTLGGIMLGSGSTAASGNLFLGPRADVCRTVYRLRECLVLD